MVREGIQIGPLFIHFYGVIIMSGALLAAWLTSLQAKHGQEDPERIWDMLPWLLVAGIIGARIWHVLTPPDSMVSIGITTQYYFTHPLDMIAIWNGGLGIPGAVIGGALALYIYTRVKKISFAKWVDFIAPGLAVAQAIGRWGNFVNQELYGAPTNLPWKLFIDERHRIAGYENSSYYHPLFLYEFLYNMVNFALLLFISRKYASKLKSGDVFLVYLIVYPVGRFLLEFLRLDPSSVGMLNANQTLMGSIAVASTAFLLWRHLRPSQKSTPEIEEQAEEQPPAE